MANTYLCFVKQRSHLATFEEIIDHIEILRILERSPNSHQEWMLDLKEHSDFIASIFYLLRLDDLLFLPDFQSVESRVEF